MKPFNVFPYDSNFDFMRLRWVSLAIAALLLLGAISAIAFKGFNFALDFTGGVSVELRYDKVPDVDEVRAKLHAAGYEGAQVQRFGGGNDVLVKLQAQEQQAGDQVNSIGELLEKTEDDLLAITNFGQKSLDEVIAKLDERGLSLRTRD